MAFTPYSNDDLKSLFFDVVESGKRHKNYQHTVDKARLYYAIMTGIGQEEYIWSVKDKEKDEQKKRRIKFHHPRTKSIANRIVSEFDELDRNENTIDILKYENSDDSPDRIKNLTKFLSCFSHGANAKEHLTHRVKELNFFDPNAFIVIEQNEGYTYPIEIYSHQVYDFEFSYGALQYLIHFTKKKVNDVDVVEYVLRAKGYSIKGVRDAEKWLSVVEYNTKTTETPAIRVGYKLDPETNNKTAVGILEPATEEFKALMWTGSELDLHNKNHGFLQKFIYAPKCEHTEPHANGVNSCIGGKMSQTGTDCPTGCSGGFAVHRSTSDIVAISKPNNADEAIIGLSDMVHYVPVPTTIIDGIKTDSQEFENRIIRTIFNSEVFDQAQVMPTATQVGLNKAAKYPAYSKVGKKISKAIVMAVKITSEYNGITQGLINYHEFPKDWKLETLPELIAIRQSMITAGVTSEFVDEIDNRINKILNRDNPDELMKSRARQNHKPFRHLTESQRMVVVDSLPEDHEDRVLFNYFDAILDDIDDDLWNKNVKEPKKFHELSRKEQIEVVKAKTKEYIAEKVVVENLRIEV